jgi:hypothetical protein
VRIRSRNLARILLTTLVLVAVAWLAFHLR